MFEGMMVSGIIDQLNPGNGCCIDVHAYENRGGVEMACLTEDGRLIDESPMRDGKPPLEFIDGSWVTARSPQPVEYLFGARALSPEEMAIIIKKRKDAIGNNAGVRTLKNYPATLLEKEAKKKALMDRRKPSKLPKWINRLALSREAKARRAECGKQTKDTPLTRSEHEQNDLFNKPSPYKASESEREIFIKYRNMSLKPLMTDAKIMKAMAQNTPVHSPGVQAMLNSMDNTELFKGLGLEILQEIAAEQKAREAARQTTAFEKATARKTPALSPGDQSMLDAMDNEQPFTGMAEKLQQIMAEQKPQPTEEQRKTFLRLTREAAIRLLKDQRKKDREVSKQNTPSLNPGEQKMLASMDNVSPFAGTSEPTAEEKEQKRIEFIRLTREAAIRRIKEQRSM